MSTVKGPILSLNTPNIHSSSYGSLGGAVLVLRNFADLPPPPARPRDFLAPDCTTYTPRSFMFGMFRAFGTQVHESPAYNGPKSSDKVRSKLHYKFSRLRRALGTCIIPTPEQLI